MDAPWFLQVLDLSADTDARTIKRAYAARLKRIDQATDIEGFTRLHQAYRAALQWHAARMPDPSGEVRVRPVGAPPAIEAMPPAVVTGAPAAAPADPGVRARRAAEQLQQDLASGAPAAQSLQAQLDLLRRGHLQEPALFEGVLIEGLAQGAFADPLALFRAACPQFGWDDVNRLAQLGPRGQWLGRLLVEERMWAREAATLEGANWFEWLQQSGSAPPPRALAALWPRVQAVLQRYPNYMRLRLDASMLAAWKAAFDALPALDRDLAERPSPAQYIRSRPDLHTRSRTDRRPGGAHGIGFVVVAMMVLGQLIHALAPDEAPPRTPPVVHAVPRTPVPDAHDACERIHREFGSILAVPKDPARRRILERLTLACLKRAGPGQSEPAAKPATGLSAAAAAFRAGRVPRAGPAAAHR